MDNEKIKTVDIGIPKTVGELSKILANYPDDMPLEFYNGPRLNLSEFRFGDYKSLVFIEPKIDGIVIENYIPFLDDVIKPIPENRYLYCSECETRTPVKFNDNAAFCAECETRH